MLDTVVRYSAFRFWLLTIVGKTGEGRHCPPCPYGSYALGVAKGCSLQAFSTPALFFCMGAAFSTSSHLNFPHTYLLLRSTTALLEVNPSNAIANLYVLSLMDIRLWSLVHIN